VHGIKLSREFRPILNVASVLATYREFDPLYQKLYAEDKDNPYKYSCCGGQLPGINPDLPRTADEVSDQGGSPPKSSGPTANEKKKNRSPIDNKKST